MRFRCSRGMRGAFDPANGWNSCRVLVLSQAAALAAIDGGAMRRRERTPVMSASKATLHMLCGKIAASKSTLSRRLGAARNTVVISEDRWIAQLYPSEIKALGDYFERCERLRGTLAPHIVELLRVRHFDRSRLSCQHGALEEVDARSVRGGRRVSPASFSGRFRRRMQSAHACAGRLRRGRRQRR